jgi:uncharacterized membrane protein
MAPSDLKSRTTYLEGIKRIRTRQAPLADIVWIILGGISLIGLITLGEISPGISHYLFLLRIPLALIYVLYAPGYLLQVVLFPHQEDLDSIERVGLSLTFSVALVSILALVLNGLPWGLILWSIVLGQTVMILLLMAVAMARGRTTPAEQAYAPQLRLQPHAWWSNLGISDRRLITMLAVTLLLAGLATTWIVVVPSDTDFMTEFYILGKDGLAEDYPRSTLVDNPFMLTVGVTNLEREPATYWIILKVGNRTISNIEPFSLGMKETWRGQLSLAMPEAGDNQRVDILLGRENYILPYRSLRLWVDVKPNL